MMSKIRSDAEIVAGYTNGEMPLMQCVLIEMKGGIVRTFRFRFARKFVTILWVEIKSADVNLSVSRHEINWRRMRSPIPVTWGAGERNGFKRAQSRAPQKDPAPRLSYHYRAHMRVRERTIFLETKVIICPKILWHANQPYESSLALHDYIIV